MIRHLVRLYLLLTLILLSRITVSAEQKIEMYEVQLSEAERYLNTQEFPSAIQAINYYLLKDSANPYAFNLRGRAYFSLNRFDKAIKDFNKALDLDTLYGEAYINRGAAYYMKRNYDFARQDYMKALENNPDYPEALYRLGHVYKNGFGDTTTALQCYTRALTCDPRHVFAHINRGNIYFDRGDYNSAINDFTNAIEADSVLTLAFYSRGLAYFMAKNYDSALEDFTQVLISDKKNYPAAYYKGIALENVGKTAEAKSLFKEFLPKVPPSDSAIYNYMLSHSE